MAKAYLTLENGTVFSGERFGAGGEVFGEIFFSTEVCGFAASLTDPASYGKILVQSFPMLGNYGIITPEKERKKASVSAVVVREWCELPSNFRSEGNYDEFLKELGVVGLCGVDTREIVRIIRDNGTMRAAISQEPLNSFPDVQKNSPYEAVSTPKKAILKPEKDRGLKVAVIDLGITSTALSALLAHGCTVALMPYDSTASEILEEQPDGLFISAGPENDGEVDIKALASLKDRLPMYGVGAGFLALCRLYGREIVKLPHGHHGSYPVIEGENSRGLITSQNHSYTMAGEGRFFNAEDGSCEGENFKDSVFGTTFYPESCDGTGTKPCLYCEFVEKMGGGR